MRATTQAGPGAMRAIFLVIAAVLLLVQQATAQDNYELGPDSKPQPGVPHGETRRYSLASKVFPGTQRDFGVYVPKQYDPAKPACVMFFQDGGGFNLEYVFDNLIFKEQMPVTIAIMIPPGVVPAANKNALPRYNRSHEYDGMSGDYARFLIEEVLPEVSKSFNLSKDPNDRALCGASSGGIAAFTAAWQRPDQFRRVIGFVSSFTDLQGGNLYNSQIRKFEPKPIRVFLQEGSNDQDIYSGSWPNGNKDVYDALRYSGYDCQLVMGSGPHSGRHGASILPDAMRWLWRDYPAPIAQPNSARWPLSEAWIPGENWQQVEGPSGRIGGLAGDTDGSVWVSLPNDDRIVRVGPDGKLVSGEAVPVRSPQSLAMGPQRTLYVAQPNQRRIVRVMLSGARKVETVATGVTAIGLAVTHEGAVYFSDGRDGKIYLAAGRSKPRSVSAEAPNAGSLVLTPDQSLLISVPTTLAKWGYSLQRQPDGGLTYCQAYFDLHVPYGAFTSGAGGMAVDTNGWLYVASTDGVQFLDQAGRVNGILSNPTRDASEQIAFGGADRSTLYVSTNGALYRRRVHSKGVLACEPPIKPPAPRL